MERRLLATSAPLVANGVLITGMAGGESIRGFLDGWDPDTGKKLWRRYTIPAPGEPGAETWPQNSDALNSRWRATWRTVPTIPNSIWSTGAPATRSRDDPRPARRTGQFVPAA